MWSLHAGATLAQQAPKTSIIEITGPKNSPVPAQSLAVLCRAEELPATTIYGWHNHLIAYGEAGCLARLHKRVVAAYQGYKVKLCGAPLYRFSRRHCTDDKAVSKAWDHVVLTASLVADTSMQQQYVAHHATLPEQWPEVEQGFCNASFQQLQVFRNGRQLVLVISIPHGASFEKLNAETTRNNPRANDWNSLMRRFQTGLPGTKPGEVWVFMKPIAKTN